MYLDEMSKFQVSLVFYIEILHVFNTIKCLKRNIYKFLTRISKREEKFFQATPLYVLGLNS